MAIANPQLMNSHGNKVLVVGLRQIFTNLNLHVPNFRFINCAFFLLNFKHLHNETCLEGM